MKRDFSGKTGKSKDTYQISKNEKIDVYQINQKVKKIS